LNNARPSTLATDMTASTMNKAPPSIAMAQHANSTALATGPMATATG